MATIQHAIDVNVPVTRLYIQLTQFEEYPRFLENVESVRQTDRTHLHWTVNAANRPLEWDAEITEQEENRHIVWHNVRDGRDAAKIEMEELGPDLSRIIFTIDAQPGRPSGISGGATEEEIARQLSRDLVSLKEFLENSASRGFTHYTGTEDFNVDEVDAQTQADLMNRRRRQAIRSASVSGSPTSVLEDEPNESGPGLAGKASRMTGTRSSGHEDGGSVP